MPTALTANMSLMDTFATAAVDHAFSTANGCASSFSGKDRAYSITLATNQRLTVTFTPGAALGVDGVLNLVDGTAGNVVCGNGATCVAAANTTGSDSVETLTYDNSSGASKTLYLVVSDYGDSASMGTYGIATTVGTIPPPPANDTCAGAIALAFTNNTVTATGDTTNATNGNTSADPAPSCSTTARSSGRDVVYSYTLTAARDVAITVTPTSPPTPTTFEPVVYVRSVCADTTVANQRACGANFTSAVSTLNLQNQPAGTYFLWVDGSSATSGTFSLTVTTATATLPPYTKTSITAACQDMTTGAALAGPVADDTASAITALPIPFSFFNTAVTNYSVTSNGFAQLWPSATGSPSSSASPTAIPSTTGPNNMMAVFWDDLINVTGTTVKTLTTGTMPNRKFTIEWANFSLYDGTIMGAGPERLTFQAQLYETTNVIEYHYCTLAANAGDAPRTTGGAAAVGVENAAGTSGVQHSFNTTAAVSTANAIRFTP